jgi:uncharacterized protein (TIGR03437 family)
MPKSLRLFAAALIFAPVALLAQDCPVAQQVKLAIQPTPASALPGQTVRFAIFAAAVNNMFDPSGSISVSDGATDLGTYNLAFAQTSFTATFYTAGAHTLRLVYNGDTNYCANTTYFGMPVDRITPTIAIGSSAGTSPFGATVTFTATVGPPAPTGVSSPVGPVQFLDNGVLLGSADLTSGKAVYATAALTAGTHQIIATLIGDPNWYSVRTAPLVETIAPASTTTLLNAIANTSGVTFSASVNSAGVVPQTGTIQILDTTSNSTLATLALPTVSATLPLAQVSVGHQIAAIYNEGVSFASSTSNKLSLAAIINAAGATSPNIARDEIVSLFGAGLATTTLQASGSQQSTTLGGITVNITDQTGTVRPAGLYLVSPTQINFVVPAVQSGSVTLAVAGSNVIPMQIAASSVAPGLFNPGPQILRVAADGTQTVEPVTTGAITIGPDPTYLIFYATGVRNRSSLSAVTVNVGNVILPVTYAGPQTQFPGLDQVNMFLPESLKSAGKVNVSLTADSQTSNAIPLQFQ